MGIIKGKASDETIICFLSPVDSNPTCTFPPLDKVFPLVTGPLEKLLAANELREVDGFVRWERHNQAHPRNWSRTKKAFNAGVIISLQYFTTAIGISGIFACSMHWWDDVSAILGTFGRKKLYVGSTIVYCIFCIIIAAIPSLTASVVGRFVTGFVSPIPALVTAGSIEDMFNARARIWVMWGWGTAGNLGLVTGPILGSYIAFWYGWRWIYYFAAMILLMFFCLTLLLDETRPSRILQQKVFALQRQSGHTIHVANPDHVPSFRAFVELSLTRPIRLLFTEPIVAVISIICALSFGLIVSFTEALPVVYASFGFTTEQASLAFIPLGLGLFLSALIRLYDYRFANKRRKQGRQLVPEDKLFGFAIAAPVLAASLWAFTCTIPPLAARIPWIFSTMALVPVGFAANEIACTLAGYLADSYTTYAASAFAGYLLVRSSTCAILPLFTHQMYHRLGPNAASSIIAAFATVCCLCPVVLFRYGRRIRKASAFAKYSLEIYRENAVDEFEDDAVGKSPPDQV